MTIEILRVLPTHEKVEDGYAYNEKYIGNVFKHNDSLLYFKEKSYAEFPLKIFEAYKQEILSTVQEENTKLKDEHVKLNKDYADLNINYDKLAKLNSDLDKHIEILEHDIASIRKEIVLLSKKQNSKESITDIVEQLIDQKLTDVYNNFNNVTNKLVTDTINNALKDSKRDQTGKLKMSTLMMAKEMGLTPDEIIKYSENGLL